jgi:protein dithiol oxidoreductase (disulfide-forming)
MSIARVLHLLAAIVLLLAATAASAQAVAGRDYQVLKQPQPTESGNKVEVLEFFWYGCPHCNTLQRPLEAWLKRKPADVEFRRMPAAFQKDWLPLARVYYTLEAMGLLEKLHQEVFAAIHTQKVNLNDPALLSDWIASKGVDRKKFKDTYDSFSVQSRTQRVLDVTRAYDIPGTPALIIDGRYLTAPSMVVRADKTIDYERYFKIVDEMIAVARKNKAAK